MPSKCQELYMQRSSVTSQKNWMFSNTAVGTLLEHSTRQSGRLVQWCTWELTVCLTNGVKTITCEFLCFYSGIIQDCSLLGCDIALLCSCKQYSVTPRNNGILTL